MIDTICSTFQLTCSATCSSFLFSSTLISFSFSLWEGALFHTHCENSGISCALSSGVHSSSNKSSNRGRRQLHSSGVQSSLKRSSKRGWRRLHSSHQLCSNSVFQLPENLSCIVEHANLGVAVVVLSAHQVARRQIHITKISGRRSCVSSSSVQLPLWI